MKITKLKKNNKKNEKKIIIIIINKILVKIAMDCDFQVLAGLRICSFC